MKINIQKCITAFLCITALMFCCIPVDVSAAAVLNIKPAPQYPGPYYPGDNILFQAFDGDEQLDNMVVSWSVESKVYPGQVDELTRFDIPGILMLSPIQAPGTIVVKATYGSQTATYNLVVAPPSPLMIYPEEQTYIAGTAQAVPLSLITEDGLEDPTYQDLKWDYNSTQPDEFYVNEHGDLIITEDSFAPAMCIVRAVNGTSGEVLASTRFYLVNDITGNMGQANGGLGGAVGDYENSVGQLPTIPGDLMQYVDTNAILESANVLGSLFTWNAVNSSLLAPMISVLGISMLCYIPMGKKG